MAAIIVFLALAALAAGLLVAGVAMVGGAGPALIAGALCVALAAFGLRQGMING